MNTARASVPRLLLTILCVGCTPWPTEIEQISDPEEEIRQEVLRSGLPSLAAGVVSDGALVWEGHFGFANVAEQRPADALTFYGVASVSKTVVATATLQLVERGLIDLDADLNTYFPFDVRNPAHAHEAITAFHLLTHTSGLNWPESETEVPGFYDPYPMDASPPLGTWLPELLLPGGPRYVPAVWMDTGPGAREYYSNIGTALLAHLVEVVSGMDFNAYCRVSIFDPLQMSSTSYAFADLDMAHSATQYGARGQPLPFTRGMAYPIGDLKTTIGDFAKLMSAYLNGGRFGSVRILQPSSVESIFTVHNEASGTGLIWGRTVGGWYGHAGGKDGVAAYMELHPPSGVGLMVVANARGATVYPGNRAHALVRRIAQQYMD